MTSTLNRKMSQTRRYRAPDPYYKERKGYGDHYSSGVLTAKDVLRVLSEYQGASLEDFTDPVRKLLLAEDTGAMDMFRAAFTPKTRSTVDNMELFELIGDSVLNCVVVAEILHQEPELVNISAGIVYRLMNEVTSTSPLANIAKTSGVADLVLGSTEKHDPKVLEDTVEAVIGALASLSIICPPEDESRVLRQTENFVLNLVRPVLDRELGRVRGAMTSGQLISLYLKDSERANHVLAVGQARYKIIEGADNLTSVRQIGSDGRPFGRSLLSYRGESKRAARDMINRMILDRPEVFGATLFDANMGESAEITKFVDRPVTNADLKRAAHVAALFEPDSEMARVLKESRGIVALRTAFTDPRINQTVRGHGMFNMLGDRLLKMYTLLRYLPRRFPTMMTCSSVAEISSGLSRLSQCRSTLARRLGLVRHVEVSAKAFTVTTTSNSNAANRSYNDVLAASFSSLLSVSVYLITDGFRKGPGLLSSSLNFLTDFVEPLIDSVDFVSLNKSYSLGGKATMSDVSRNTKLIKEAHQEEKPDTSTHRRTLQSSVRIGNHTIRGLGINKSESHDDLADKVVSAMLGHPYRSALDPGDNYPNVDARMHLFGVEHRK